MVELCMLDEIRILFSDLFQWVRHNNITLLIATSWEECETFLQIRREELPDFDGIS